MGKKIMTRTEAEVLYDILVNFWGILKCRGLLVSAKWMPCLKDGYVRPSFKDFLFIHNINIGGNK